MKPKHKYFTLTDEVEFEIHTNSKCKKILVMGDTIEHVLTCTEKLINSRFYVFSGKFNLNTNIVTLYGSEDL